MAIHYYPKLGRFKDDTGRFVSKDRAMRSSIARGEYQRAQAPKPKAAPSKPAARKAAKPAQPAKLQKVSHAKPKSAPAAPVAERAKAPAAKSAPRKKGTTAKKTPKRRPRSRPSPADFPPWDVEGDIREFPARDEWFPDAGAWDHDYGYDDLADDWGDYPDDDTTSGGPGGQED